MNNSHGNKLEDELCLLLNENKYKDLNENLKAFLAWLFNYNIKDTDIIFAEKHKKIKNKNLKPDIWIKINNTIKNVSIKTGKNNSVHQEKESSFSDFLSSGGISNNTIKTIKLFHYGDGTLNGTGEERLPENKIVKKYSKEIQAANDEINANPNLSLIISRALFSGNFDNPIMVDAIYYGSTETGLWASREEVLQYLLDNKNLNKSKGIHFSYLNYQPWQRNLTGLGKHPKGRFDMQFKWNLLEICLREIARRRKDNGNK